MQPAVQGKLESFGINKPGPDQTGSFVDGENIIVEAIRIAVIVNCTITKVPRILPKLSRLLSFPLRTFTILNPEKRRAG